MRRLDEERNGEGMIDKPEYIITFANLQGLEGAGLDETGETFATDDSRLEFVKEICKDVRSRPYTAPAEQEIRDKVLDEVVRIVKEWRSDYWNEQISIGWFKAKINELRIAPEQP